MDSVSNQVTKLASNASPAERKKILNTLDDLYQEVETPENARFRLQTRVLQGAMLATADDLRIFHRLSESETPLTTSQLAEKSGASPALLIRVLRYLASCRFIEQLDENTFAAKRLTKTLGTDEFHGDLQLYFNFFSRPYIAIPAYLKQLSYQEPNDRHRSAFNVGWETDKDLFEWISERPDITEYFNQYMVNQHKWSKQFFDVYPLHELANGLRPNQVFFVDVGGGFGHQALAVKKSFPDTRVVLQELPFQVDQIGDVGGGVEVVAQDACEEQNTKGARAYYLRNIFHDHTDDRCITMLSRLADGMADDSAILIDEVIMPAVNPNFRATDLDFTMMCSFSAKERTLAQWKELLARTGRGLSIRRVVEYYENYHKSIIEVGKDGK